MNIVLAQLGGNAVVSSLIYLIVIGVVFWLLFWLIGYVNLPSPFDKVAKVILAIAAVIILINILMAMVGRPLLRF